MEIIEGYQSILQSNEAANSFICKCMVSSSEKRVFNLAHSQASALALQVHMRYNNAAHDTGHCRVRDGATGRATPAFIL
eukprot:5646431-Pleurochrysis_carterae.AAC.1